MFAKNGARIKDLIQREKYGAVFNGYFWGRFSKFD
jgi:hypothetical protein